MATEITWETSKNTYSRSRCEFLFPITKAQVPGSALDLGPTIKVCIDWRSDHPGEFGWEASDGKRHCGGFAKSAEAAKVHALKAAALLWVLLENEHGQVPLPEALGPWFFASEIDDYPIGGN